MLRSALRREALGSAGGLCVFEAAGLQLVIPVRHATSVRRGVLGG